MWMTPKSNKRCTLRSSTACSPEDVKSLQKELEKLDELGKLDELPKLDNLDRMDKMEKQNNAVVLIVS